MNQSTLDRILTNLQENGICWFLRGDQNLGQINEIVSTLGLDPNKIEVMAGGIMVGLRVVDD